MRTIQRNVFKGIVYCVIVSVVILGIIYFQMLGRTITFENVLSFVGYVNLLTAIVWQLWEHWLWRWPALSHIPNLSVPNLSGRWTGFYQRIGQDSDGEKHAYILEIKQSFSRIDCTTYQDNGTSSSAIIAEVCDLQDRRVCIVFHWEGITQTLLERSERLKRSDEQYRGLTRLVYSSPSSESEPAVLDGEYFTNRETRGVVHVEKKPY